MVTILVTLYIFVLETEQPSAGSTYTENYNNLPTEGVEINLDDVLKVNETGSIIFETLNTTEYTIDTNILCKTINEMEDMYETVNETDMFETVNETERIRALSHEATMAAPP